MSEWWLIGGLVGLGVSGLTGLVMPLKLARERVVWLLLIIIILLYAAYSRWGSYHEWHIFAQSQRNQQQVKALLATEQGRKELITQLRTRLNKTPDNAYGWMLLGKLYLTIGDEVLAQQAFELAKKLNTL